jgi:GrpB-like predicted nucleotidyltransferase (UPF0157 family)
MSLPIELVAYDDTWPRQFELEREHLLNLLGPWVAGEIEHIGSTAVPGLAAKPIIDVMAPVASLEESRPAIQTLGTSGYCYYPYKARVMHWFCKPSPEHRTHHLHLVVWNSELWRERLSFRNALRNSASLAAEYAALKCKLAVRFAHDRDGYTAAKSSFINRVLANRQSESK